MMKNNWEEMSNSDIKIKLFTMKEEYESIKNQISNLTDKLDEMDVEYQNGNNELIKRNYII